MGVEPIYLWLVSIVLKVYQDCVSFSFSYFPIATKRCWPNIFIFISKTACKKRLPSKQSLMEKKMNRKTTANQELDSLLTSYPLSTAMWKDKSCMGITVRIPWSASTACGTSKNLYACFFVSSSPALHISMGRP